MCVCVCVVWGVLGGGAGTSATLNHSFTHSPHTFVFGSENIIDVPANHLIWTEAVPACPPSDWPVYFAQRLMNVGECQEWVREQEVSAGGGAVSSDMTERFDQPRLKIPVTGAGGPTRLGGWGGPGGFRDGEWEECRPSGRTEQTAAANLRSSLSPCRPAGVGFLQSGHIDGLTS